MAFGVLQISGWAGMLLAPGTVPSLWAVSLGLSGFAFPTAIALITARSRAPHVTAQVSGFTQSLGYLLAAAGPLAVGALHDLTGGWTVPLGGVMLLASGAFALSGATILDAKIFTMTNGMAVDVFLVQDAAGGAFDSGDKLAKLAVMIERTLSGQLRPLQELAKRKPGLTNRTRVFKVPPRVLIDNKASTTHTVIELNGRDRPGLLYDVTRALTNLSLQISSAKISTYGEKAIDVFYVKDVFGLKITHESKLAQIREKVLTALSDPVADAQADSGRFSAAERSKARSKQKKPALPRRKTPAETAAE